MTAATKTKTPPLDDAQRALVEEHMPMVHALASRWRAAQRQNIEQADLVQVGAIGLMEAARRFDPERRAAFRAFARTRIEGAIRDTLRAVDPLSRNERQGVRRLEVATRELRGRLCRQPEPEELAAELGWDADETRRRQDDLYALQRGLARTLPEPTDHGTCFEGPTAAYDAVLEGQLNSKVAEAIDELPERQQVVLSLYHHEGLTLKEVGELLGVTESRACQIHSAAMKTLRAALRSLLPRAVAVA